MTNPDVVILETIRGGKDPDQYYHVITVGLANELDDYDPWSTLSGLETVGDERILASYLNTEHEARQWCKNNGFTPELELFEAVGY